MEPAHVLLASQCRHEPNTIQNELDRWPDASVIRGRQQQQSAWLEHAGQRLRQHRGLSLVKMLNHFEADGFVETSRPEREVIDVTLDKLNGLATVCATGKLRCVGIGVDASDSGAA